MNFIIFAHYIQYLNPKSFFFLTKVKVVDFFLINKRVKKIWTLNNEKLIKLSRKIRLKIVDKELLKFNKSIKFANKSSNFTVM